MIHQQEKIRMSLSKEQVKALLDTIVAYRELSEERTKRFYSTVAELERRLRIALTSFL